MGLLKDFILLRSAKQSEMLRLQLLIKTVWFTIWYQFPQRRDLKLETRSSCGVKRCHLWYWSRLSCRLRTFSVNMMISVVTILKSFNLCYQKGLILWTWYIYPGATSYIYQKNSDIVAHFTGKCCILHLTVVSILNWWHTGYLAFTL